MVFTLALAAGIGFVNGAGIAYLRVHPLIMTLAMATLLQGLLVIIAGGSAVSVQNPLVVWFGSARPAGIPAGILLWLAVSAATLMLAARARPSARASLRSAPTRWRRGSPASTSTAITMLLYTFSGLMAGLAGILVLGMNRQGYVGIGDPYLLASIAAVVLGGTSILGGRGTYAGTIPAAILLVTITAHHHRGQRLAGLAEHPLRLPAAGDAAAVRPRQHALETRKGMTMDALPEGTIAARLERAGPHPAGRAQARRELRALCAGRIADLPVRPGAAAAGRRPSIPARSAPK